MRYHFPDVRRYLLPSPFELRDRIAGGGLQRPHHVLRKILRRDRHTHGGSRRQCSLTTHRQELAAPPGLSLLLPASKHSRVPSSKEPPCEESPWASTIRS